MSAVKYTRSPPLTHTYILIVNQSQFSTDCCTMCVHIIIFMMNSGGFAHSSTSLPDYSGNNFLGSGHGIGTEAPGSPQGEPGNEARLLDRGVSGNSRAVLSC